MIEFNSSQTHWFTDIFRCNVCDSKFMSLKYLYEHRKQMGHFFSRLGDDLNRILEIGCEKCDVDMNSTETVSLHNEEHYESKVFIGSLWKDVINKCNKTKRFMMNVLTDGWICKLRIGFLVF